MAAEMVALPKRRSKAHHDALEFVDEIEAGLDRLTKVTPLGESNREQYVTLGVHATRLAELLRYGRIIH